MKQIQDVPVPELVYQLRKLQAAAKEVAYAKNETDAEFFTMRYLRPEIEKVEKLLKQTNESN